MLKFSVKKYERLLGMAPEEIVVRTIKQFTVNNIQSALVKSFRERGCENNPLNERTNE